MRTGSPDGGFLSRESRCVRGADPFVVRSGADEYASALGIGLQVKGTGCGELVDRAYSRT